MRVCMCLIVLCWLTFCCPAADGQTPKKNERPAEWEYKQLPNPVDEVLNHYAKEGWEIVTATGGGGDIRVILRRSKSHPLFRTPTANLPTPEPPPPQNATCRRSLAQAPVIRGLRLGMTSDELFAVFPANEREGFDRTQRLKSAELPPDYGYTSFRFDPPKYATTQDRFTGIGSLDFGLLDKRVVLVRAYYVQAPPFDSVGQLLEIITKQFGLPERKDWPGYQGNENENYQSLSCDGFTFAFRGYGSSSFSIEVLEPKFEKIIKERRQADLAKKRSGFTL